MREWVSAVGRVLGEEEVGRKLRGGEGENDDVEGWMEVWDVRIRNRCEGWVVEPWHDGWGSLEDDDEVSYSFLVEIGE